MGSLRGNGTGRWQVGNCTAGAILSISTRRPGGTVTANGHPHPALRPDDHHVLECLRTAGPLSRPQLSTRTRLSLPPILAAVARLIGCGALVTAGRGAGGRRRPNAQLYDIDARLKFPVGAAVSASEIELTVVDLRGRPLATEVQPLNAAESATQVSDLVIDMAHLAGADDERLAHVVVGVHAQIERRTGDRGFAWALPRA